MRIRQKKAEEIHIGHRKTDEQVVDIDNPFYQRQYRDCVANPKKVGAIINAADNPIAIMHKKGHITDAQKRAADKFYQCYIVSLGSSNMGLDYRRQKVDGGRFGSHAMIKPISAQQELLHAKSVLGVVWYDLVVMVAGQGVTIARGFKNKREQNIQAHNLRECLNVLAELWGYAPQKKVV